MAVTQPPRVAAESDRHASLIFILRGWWRARRAQRASIPSVEEQVRAIENRATAAHHQLAFVPILVLLVLSATLAVVGVVIDLNLLIPGLALLVAVISAALTVLQGIDWLWPNAVTRRYRMLAERLTSKVARLRGRQKLRRLFALYGREELSQRFLAPDDAQYFTIPRQRARGRRYRWGIAVSLLVVAAGYALYAWPGHIDKWYGINDQFSLDDAVKITILTGPSCQIGVPEYVGRMCSVKAQVLNDSPDAVDVGPGSFGLITSKGSFYRIDYAHDVRYATAAMTGPDYCDYRDFQPFSDLQPRRSSENTFSYRADGDIVIDQLLFSAASRPNVTVHVRLNLR